jgi:hypothetical protein
LSPDAASFALPQQPNILNSDDLAFVTNARKSAACRHRERKRTKPVSAIGRYTFANRAGKTSKSSSTLTGSR